MAIPATVTGNLKALTNGSIAQGLVIFQLANTGSGNPIIVSGTAIFPSLKIITQSAADGSFSQTLWGNDNISPSNTIYNVTFRDAQGNEVGPIQYSITGSSVNLNSLSASSTTSPPVLIPTSSLPEIATVSLTGQNASIATTTLYAVPAGGAGVYRLSYSIIATATGTGNVNPSVIYNNGSAGQTIIGSTISLAGLGNEAGNAFEFYSAANQNISYATTYTSPGSYALRLRLENLA
jgi:hypothetical protein